ncbi:transcriptional regulator GcvA [Hoeflea sp. TYP-13]|uniref:transcriptional regulator GcvA n=1 Tax=Hoeflea sp. TYP-13 TaxID=3230023 RepID=UPI0034C5E23D
MKRRLPPLNWLRAFEASARHLSFTSAAEELNLTQAAVSKQVKLLEQYLREPLFYRKPRSLVLTKVGAAYLPKVNDSFMRLAEGTEEVFGHRRSGLLTVRATVSFAVTWLGPRLHRYYERHPDHPVRIVSSVWNDEFDRESFDLDIRYGTGNWPGFHCDRLTWGELTPLCSPRLLEGKNKLQDPEDLRHHNLLQVLGYEDGWTTWLKAAGVENINAGQGQQFDSSLMAFAVAESGAGVVLGRSAMVGDMLASGRLVKPFELSVPVEEAIYLIFPMDGTGHPDSELFRTWLLEEAQAAKIA